MVDRLESFCYLGVYSLRYNIWSIKEEYVFQFCGEVVVVVLGKFFCKMGYVFGDLNDQQGQLREERRKSFQGEKVIYLKVQNKESGFFRGV